MKEKTFSASPAATSQPFQQERTANKVLARDLSRDVAYRALVRRRGRILKDAGISRFAWGSFARVFRVGLVALAREVRATGRCAVVLTLSQWATLANQRRYGAKTKAHSLKPHFTEHKGQYGDDRDDPRDDLRVTLDVVTPGKRGREGTPGEYGFAVRFARSGELLKVASVESARPWINAVVHSIEERQRALDEEEAVIRATYSRLAQIPGSRFAAGIRLLARKHGIHLPIIIALALVWVFPPVAVTAVSVATYKVVQAVKSRNAPQRPPSRQPAAPQSRRSDSEVTVFPYDEPRVVELTKWDVMEPLPILGSSGSRSPLHTYGSDVGPAILAGDAGFTHAFTVLPSPPSATAGAPAIPAGPLEIVVDFGDGSAPERQKLPNDLRQGFFSRSLQGPLGRRYTVSAWIYSPDASRPENLIEVIRKHVIMAPSQDP